MQPLPPLLLPGLSLAALLFAIAWEIEHHPRESAAGARKELSLSTTVAVTLGWALLFGLALLVVPDWLTPLPSDAPSLSSLSWRSLP